MLNLHRDKEYFNDWGGRGYDDSVPGDDTKKFNHWLTRCKARSYARSKTQIENEKRRFSIWIFRSEKIYRYIAFLKIR